MIIVCHSWLNSPFKIICFCAMFPQQMVRPGKGIQCVSDGLAWSQFRGPFQFLPKKFHNENCADVGWSGENGR